MAKLRIKEELVPLSKVVMRPHPKGGFEVVRQHFDAVLTGEDVLEKQTTLEWASTAMEEQHEKEMQERREAEGW